MLQDYEKKKDWMILHAAELITCAGTAPKCGIEMNEVGCILDGAVIIKGKQIVAVGQTDHILKQYDATKFLVIDAAGKTVMPGFVDSHTHFIFAGSRAEEFSWRLRGDSYMSIMERGGGIIRSVMATRNASMEELIRDGRKRLNAMLRFGVTTVEGKSGYGLDKDTEHKQLEAMKLLNQEHPMDIVPTYLGAHSVPKEAKGKEREFLSSLLEHLTEIKKEQLAEFVDIFCEQNVFSVEDSRYFLEEAKKMGFGVKIHADEIVPLGGAKLAAELSAVSADHLLQATEEGIRAMAECNVIATLLPATAFSLRENFAKGRDMIDSGCAVALATDFNPGSCYTHSIPLVIALACLQMNLTIEETVTALTINGAAAVGRQKDVGSIEAGKQADLIILSCPSIQHLPYATGMNLVEVVIKNGEIVVS